MKALLSIAVAVVVMFTLTPVADVSGQQKVTQQITEGQNKVIVCNSVKCMNDVKVNSVKNRQATQEEIMRELCFSDGMAWKEKNVTYILNKGEVTGACFQQTWQTFIYGGAE